MRRAAVHCRRSHITAWRSNNSFYLDPRHTRATIPLRPPTHIPVRERGIVGSRSSQPRPWGFLFHSPAIIVPYFVLRPVTRAHLLSHIRLPLHRLHQNGNQQAALPPEAHTFVGTPRAPMVGRSVLSGEASDAGLDSTQIH